MYSKSVEVQGGHVTNLFKIVFQILNKFFLTLKIFIFILFFWKNQLNK